MKRLRVVVVVQARLGSTRLPGKVLLDLSGKTVLERVVARARAIPGADKVVVALPEGPADAPLRAVAERIPGVAVFAGSESDVLDRIYRAAKTEKADIVLRVTADCPLLDPAVGAKVLAAVKKHGIDYASNTQPPTFPDGLDIEAFRFAALERAWKEAETRSEREHVTPYLRERDDLFTRVNVANARDLSHLRWTLDEEADLELIRGIYTQLNGRTGFKEALKAMTKISAVFERAQSTRRDEGYYLGLLKNRPLPAKKLRLANSLKCLAKARTLIPGCSQTFSKAPTQFVRGVSPLFLRSGKGGRVRDVDGNEFIDVTMSLAPVSLGHCDPDVDAAVSRQLKEGTILSQPHPLEAEVAQLLAETIPCAEMARYGKNGSDATAAAIRLARYVTKRDLVAVGGYHGWQDWYIGTTTRDGGVPASVKSLTKTFQYNKLESLERLLDAHPGQFAAVIMEAIGVEIPEPGYLESLAKLVRKHGALLVFDEVVTGFRLALGGAQEHFKVTPDLAAFGKAMANGFPLAAVVGPARLMRHFDEIFFSGTFGGELLSLAACKATIGKMRRKPVIKHMWTQGRRLQDGFNVMAEELGLARHMTCIGLPPHTVVTFKDAKGEPWWELKSLLQQECVRRGYLFTGLHNPAYAHADADVEKVLRIYASALRAVKESVERGSVAKDLEGPAVQAVFRKP